MPMDVLVLGVVLGQNDFSVVGLNATGKVIVCRWMRRDTVIAYAEACQHALWRWRPAAEHRRRSW